MAIKIVSDTYSQASPDAIKKVTLDIDNGDLEALKSLKEEWNFIDEPSVLRFALAVLTKAGNKKVYIDQDGKPSAITPSEKLLKQPATASEANK